MKKYPRFVDRKIRNGRVKIFGRWFYPSEKYMKYDGRLDGLRYHFGLYEGAPGELKDFVYLWGLTEKSKNPGVDEIEVGPHCVDGHYNWDWWNAK